MKKTFLAIAVLLGVLSVTITSCKKDDDDNPNPPGTSGTYQLYMDNNLITEGTTDEVGMVANAVTLSEGETISLLLSSVPLTVGETIDIDGSNCTVSITGKNLLLSDGSDELYFSIDGSMTRVSDSKISFEGNCSALMGTSTHTFNGYVESDVYKVIQ
nr:hypothetical protein [Bacteroidota bacterium]